MDPTQSPASDIDLTQTTPNTNANSTPPAVPQAVLDRIGELTADKHELKRQMDQQNQILQELLANQAAMAVRATQPAPIQPQMPEGVDPAVIDYISKTFNQSMKTELESLKREMTGALGNVRANQQNTELQQALVGVPPEVAKVAKQLYADWQRNGNTGWAPIDAVVYARGAVAQQQEANIRRTQPNGSGNDAITPGGAMAPAPQSNRNLPPAKTDEELRRMSPAQQEAYWGSRVGDSDIVY